jgi:excinuclease ABC subunit C
MKPKKPVSDLLRQKIKDCPNLPGIYQMLDQNLKICYVGKAKRLKTRLLSYTKKALIGKAALMMRQVQDVRWICTTNETEALLLENTLIKKHKPKYNIRLKDDKTYPYIMLTQDAFPRLDLVRKKTIKEAKYFGPYTQAALARKIMDQMQSTFKLRCCSNHFFKTRQRPCLQYQIKRCTAPCVSYVAETAYAKQAKLADRFLSGERALILNELKENMQQAAKEQDYEQAAKWRDLMHDVHTHSTTQSVISTKKTRDYDVFAVQCDGQQAWACVLYVIEGHVLDHEILVWDRVYETDKAKLLHEIITHYYLERAEHTQKHVHVASMQGPETPQTLSKQLSDALSKTIVIHHRPRQKEVRAWCHLADLNAKDAMQQALKKENHWIGRYVALQNWFQWDRPIQRMECFDISHQQGAHTVASCVAFGPKGPIKAAYRHYNIKSTAKGDDYQAMYEAVARRYKKNDILPDLIIIDGGKGQLNKALEALHDLRLHGLPLIAIAKGPARQRGKESWFIPGHPEAFILPESDPARLLVEHIRDEAHRFALQHSRRKALKGSFDSIWKGIDGIGPKKRQALLAHFTSFEALHNASIESLCEVPGIHKALAEKIYQACQQDTGH